MSAAWRTAALALALGGALGGCRIETAPLEPDLRLEASAQAPGQTPAPAVPGVFVAPSGLAIPVAGVGPADLVDSFTDGRVDPPPPRALDSLALDSLAPTPARVHHAIDIAAPRGTPVVAASDGRVLRLFESERGGLTVYALAGEPRADGRATVHYYSHLDAYAPGLADGQRVRRGQPLGTVGDSGNAAPGNTHLHFAVWLAPSADAFWTGEPVNPYGLLGGR